MAKLLEEAISSGNRGAYEVFLDRLEEVMPVLKQRLARTKDIIYRIILLGRNFPTVIKIGPTQVITFKSPAFGRLLAISHNYYRYKKYDVNLGPASTSITFEDNTFIIDGKNITLIEGFMGDIKSVQYLNGTTNHYGDPNVSELDRLNINDEYAIEKLYLTIDTEAREDDNNIKTLFA